MVFASRLRSGLITIWIFFFSQLEEEYLGVIERLSKLPTMVAPAADAAKRPADVTTAESMTKRAHNLASRMGGASASVSGFKK